MRGIWCRTMVSLWASKGDIGGSMSISLYGAAVRISTKRARQAMRVFTAVDQSSICIRSTSTAEKGVEQDESAHDPYVNSPL